MYTVYVVDDEPLILNEIVNTVRWMDNGFEVVGSSERPNKAISEIKQLRPDVVFSDLKLPEMDGVDMIKALKDEGVEFECVILSAFANFEDSRRFFRLEGFDYLLKPMQQQEVQLVLERLSKKLSKRERPSVRDGENISDAFLKLINHIENDFQTKHTLDSLSKLFGLSPNYICNLFARHYNSTLTRYLTTLRMKHAIKLMLTSNRQYKDIATECGYTDYYYFCKVFKDYYGESPTGYLKKLTKTEY